MHSCAGTGSHTWAHEVGHALSLPHPFIGWENTNYSSGNPTPLQLTYNYTYFHDTIDTQTPAPLDTALVEYLDGSNCTVAADLFCDTKPDYLSNIWLCDGQGNSTQKQYDPAGSEFYSDGTLFMSYSSDECQSRFSDDQMIAMRANLLSEKVAWLTDTPAEGDIAGTPALLAPADGENVPETGAVLSWSTVPNATHYLLQYSRITSFQVKEFELVTTDTSYTIAADLLANKTYYWRVRPFNHWYACTPFSPQQSFVAVPVTDVAQPDQDGWRCYPSLLTQGEAITLELQENWLNKKSLCAVYDATGRQMWQTDLIPSASRLRLQLPSATWPAGVYRLIFSGENGVKTQTLLLTGG
ncbi:MAG: fibronectin type III domain-containing protein [Lewinellaceae bacterium]|nr:fibronectin type III domain-containing protein [Lewinellaceae bacterium]